MYNNVKPADTEYIRKGWDNNVKNCNIPLDRSIMICDQMHDYDSSLIEAGFILGKMGLKYWKNEASFHFCGKWWWIEFSKSEDATTFKLLWE